MENVLFLFLGYEEYITKESKRAFKEILKEVKA